MSRKSGKLTRKKNSELRNVMDFEIGEQLERPEMLVEEETDEEEALDVEIQLMQGELNELESETRSLERERKSLVEKKRTMEDKNMRTVREMETIRQDLGFIHNQVPAEGEWIQQEQIVSEFQSLKSLVAQTISTVHSWFSALKGGPLSFSAAKLARETFFLEGDDVKQFIQMAVHPHASLHTITALLLRHYLSDQITRFVFTPFLLGERSKATDALQSIYIQVRDSEPQSLGGRWKAQTYRAAQQSESKTQSLLVKLTSDFICDLTSLYIWSTREKPPAQLQQDGFHLALKVFEAAACFKERVSIYHVESHAIPYMVRRHERVRFPAQEMHNSKTPSSHRLLGLDMGLLLSTAVVEGSRSSSTWMVHVPASFVGNNSHLISRHEE